MFCFLILTLASVTESGIEHKFQLIWLVGSNVAFGFVVFGSVGERSNKFVRNLIRKRAIRLIVLEREKFEIFWLMLRVKRYVYMLVFSG